MRETFADLLTPEAIERDRLDREARVVAYFGRAAYSVALDGSGKSSPHHLTVGRAWPTVYPMSNTKSLFATDIAAATETARAFAEALAPILDDPGWAASLDQAHVPPLQMAADAAGVKLRKLAHCFYRVEGTCAYIITISVDSDGYEVRKTNAIRGRVRWKKLGKWKRPARAIREAKWWVSE